MIARERRKNIEERKERKRGTERIKKEKEKEAKIIMSMFALVELGFSLSVLLLPRTTNIGIKIHSQVSKSEISKVHIDRKVRCAHK